MRRIHTLIAAILVTSACLCVPTARAVDDPLEFLHAMQKNGYSDIAVDYLKMIKDQPKAPKDVLDRWDLEMSQSLRAAAKTAYNETEAKRFMDDAKKYLDKFIEADPKRPEAIQAGADWADISGQQALQTLRRAKDLADKDQKAEALTAVRKTLEEIRPRFLQAAESFQQTVEKMGAKDRRRPNMESQLMETRLKIAMADFYLAQTYDEAKSPERMSGLEKAARTFDAIYQNNRGTIFGLQSHFMDGRARHEQGKLDDAKAIYEEVLANDQDDTGSRGPRKKTGLEELFGEVQQYYLRCVAKESPKDYFREAMEWRTLRKATSEKTDAYQGISFELAKNLLKAAEQVGATDKAKYTTAAVKILSEMGRVTSQYQQEAIKIRRQVKGGSDGDSGFEESIVLGDESAKDKKWTEAIEHYQKAVDAAAGAKIDKKRVDAVRNAIAGCYYNMAYEHFRKGDTEKTSKALKQLLADFRDTDTAPLAAALQMNVAMNDYANAMDKEKAVKDAALKNVLDIANSIIETWPGKPEADAARLTLGRLKIVNDQIDEAAAIFKHMNPKSEHYATALYLTGYTYWRHYRIEKKTIEEKQEQNAAVTAEEKEKRDTYRKKAVKIAQTAVDSLKAAAPQADGRMPRMLIDSQLLLAEITLEGGDAKEAAGLFQPLIDEVQKTEAKSLDENMLKIFNGGVQAYLQLNELDKAAKVSEVLLKLGPDVANVNVSLLNFAKRIDAERKKADEAAENAKGATEVEAAKAKRDSYEKLLGDLLTNLSGREQLSPGGMFWIAKTMAAIKMTDQAEKQAQKILDRMDNDAKFAEAGAKAVPGIRALLIAISRQKGKYADALEQVERLIEENPKALEPKMEKGQILQAACEKDPEKYSKAVAHWERLRRGLERMKKKPKEYYDVTYNEAFCLYNWAKKEGDKENANKGRQLLKQLLLLDPKLNGPDTIARYRALVEKTEVVLGIAPEKKSGASK